MDRLFLDIADLAGAPENRLFKVVCDNRAHYAWVRKHVGYHVLRYWSLLVGMIVWGKLAAKEIRI
ncbi:hypothetical protein CLV41_10495 [Roseibium marinum]|uniref:Uncharacterized protein n=1 Tax=Roseibium marinum TaxID=281252 RepID=A0A2S3UUY2_9HYPH|nr:hypothetical protein CLV41_10495 [Roseibium marinum]